MSVAGGASAQTSQAFANLASRATDAPGEPARLTAPFFQTCEDLGDDARLAACQRSLDALRAQRRAATYRMRLRGRAAVGTNYLVRVGAYNPIDHRVPIEVGPLVFGALFHTPGHSSGALSTVPSVRGAFPSTPVLQGGYRVQDDQAGLDFTNRHHLGAGFGVDVVFRLATPWEDHVGAGASAEVREGVTLDVLAIRVVELNDGLEVRGTLDRLYDATFDAAAGEPVIMERVGSGRDAQPSTAPAVESRGDAAAPTEVGTPPAGEPSWRAPLSSAALQHLGGSREAVLAQLAREGGSCREIAGGFRGQPASVCRGLGATTGLERESPEVTLVFDGDHLRSLMVLLGRDAAQSEAVDAYRRDAAFWSARFGQQPPPGPHDRPEIIRYEVGGATIRIVLTAAQGSGGGFLRMLLVEERDFALRQDAISRGYVPNVTCGLRGTLDERALDCARPVAQGGAGPAAVRSFEVTESGQPRRFLRYRLIRQEPDGTRVWLTGHSGALAAVMRPARREEALRHCAQMPQWAELGAVPPGTMHALQQGQDSARELAELFPDVVSPMRSEWFWAGTQWGREVSIQLGDGYGTGRRTPFIRANQGAPSSEPLRYFCQASTTTDTRAPAGRAIFAESEVDSDAPCGLSGSVEERQSDCAQRLGEAANYPLHAPAGTAPWRIVSQTVQGERVWREPGSNRVWFYVPESARLNDASAVCAVPARAQGRRAYLPLPARLPTGAEFRDAAVLGLNRVLLTDPPQYWSASSRPGRLLVLGWEGAARWYEPHSPGLPAELPFFCVADAP